LDQAKIRNENKNELGKVLRVFWAGFVVKERAGRREKKSFEKVERSGLSFNKQRGKFINNSL